MSSLHKIKYVFKHSTARHVRIFSFRKSSVIKSCLSIQNCMVLRWLVQVLYPPQKFERPQILELLQLRH
jgi:hypothetical protein